jgi:DNA-binding PadR family transcriptional regulator
MEVQLPNMNINKELMKGSTTTLILKLLDKREMYGYEIVKELGQQSGGVFALKEGTLYPILHTMETQLWLNSYWSEHDGRKRKYYRISEVGRQQLKHKQEEWGLFRNSVDRVLGEGAL